MLRRSLIALGAAALLAACDRAPAPAAFQAIDITGADYAKELPLPDLDGRARTLAEFRGKAVVFFFGFTQCPDVCPTTLAEIAAVKKELGAAGERIQTVFVSLDPERDTPELLKNYVATFDRDNPYYPPGTTIKGHEFRYSTVLQWDGRAEELALRMERGTGFMQGRDGLVKNNVLALYTHVLAPGTPEWAPGIVAAARRYRERCGYAISRD